MKEWIHLKLIQFFFLSEIIWSKDMSGRKRRKHFPEEKKKEKQERTTRNLPRKFKRAVLLSHRIWLFPGEIFIYLYILKCICSEPCKTYMYKTTVCAFWLNNPGKSCQGVHQGWNLSLGIFQVVGYTGWSSL